MALWTQFYSDMGIQVKDPLLAQAVSQDIFNKLLIQSETRLASSPRPIFANFTERMTERNAKIGPGIHCRGIGAHALVVIQNLYNRQDIQNP